MIWAMSDDVKHISVNAAVAAAISAFPSYFLHPPVSVRVEEVVPPGPAGDMWRVTLSHVEPKHEGANTKAFRRIFQGIIPEEPPTERVYHVIEVDPITGSAGAMRMRERV
jgi:hypothetical protein